MSAIDLDVINLDAAGERWRNGIYTDTPELIAEVGRLRERLLLTEKDVVTYKKGFHDWADEADGFEAERDPFIASGQRDYIPVRQHTSLTSLEGWK